ncbi:acetoacetyl-CoA synthetase [Vibrio ponticus]|nr:acetoacetyl-CoA synthetase [Vibrio ponticus]
MAQQAPIWSPSKQRIAESNLTSFIKRVNQSRSSDPIGDYAALHQWSIENDVDFWRHTWHFCQLRGDLGAESKTLGDAKWQDSVANRDTIWFADTKLNYAENLLRYAQQNPEKVFILFANERGENQRLTGQQLIDQVSSIQQWLIECGVQQGDVVAGYLPYIAEAVVAMLATTSLGAIWTSTSPDFGVESVIERFGQVSPKVLFAAIAINLTVKAIR